VKAVDLDCLIVSNLEGLLSFCCNLVERVSGRQPTPMPYREGMSFSQRMNLIFFEISQLCGLYGYPTATGPFFRHCPWDPFTSLSCNVVVSGLGSFPAYRTGRHVFGKICEYQLAMFPQRCTRKGMARFSCFTGISDTGGRK